MAYLVWLIARIVALRAIVASAVPSANSLGSDIMLLVDNDLQGSVSHRPAVLLLGPRSAPAAEEGCRTLGEQLWAPPAGSKSCGCHCIRTLLDYLVYLDLASEQTRFWIAPASGSHGVSRTINARGHVADIHDKDDGTTTLPVFCTQSAPYSNQSYADSRARWQVSVTTDQDGAVVGFRDHLSFRFLGLRYAPQPDRFAYAAAYQRSGGDLSPVDATKFGSQCVQAGSTSGSEDCLFLNIFTPFLPGNSNPQKEKPSKLRPVMFWIHGGAFTSGTGSDPTFDGGNLASRGDVVVVTINYRLSTLGFLALNTTDGQNLPGNYGLADQILALDWVRANIARFGGDPDRITISGQSAGAGSVRAMMASPQAVGKFAAAIPLSNLGGHGYGTTYSRYYTIDEEMTVAGSAILEATGCADSTTANVSRADCLRALPADTLVNLETVARYIVVDGTYIIADELEVGPDRGSPQPYALMMGTMRDDGAGFISYPTAAQTANVTGYLESQDLPVPDPALFPIPAPSSPRNASLDLFDMASRLATDDIFRCIDEATVYAGLQTGRWPKVYYYEFGRSYQIPDWPGIDVCEPTRTVRHPYGDPSLPYLKCHSGELYYVFGNVARQGLPWRDSFDLPFSQYVLDSFASFARSHTPNPDVALLWARQYTNTLKQTLAKGGLWVPATRESPTVRILDWPSRQTPLPERDQCVSLGLGLDYYLQSRE